MRRFRPFRWSALSTLWYASMHAFVYVSLWSISSSDALTHFSRDGSQFFLK